MSSSNLRSVLTPNKPLVVAATILLALVTGWFFVPTLQGHVAAMNVRSVTVTPSDTSVTDNGSKLAATLTIHNPTQRDIVFYRGLIHVYHSGTQLTDGTSTAFEWTTVHPGETKTVRIKMGLHSDRVSKARQAIQSGSLRFTGLIRGRIGKKDVRVYLQNGN